MKWVYVLLILAGGLVFGAILPPFQAADEPTHMIRAIQLARGEVRGETTEQAMGCRIPESVLADLRAFRGMVGRAAVGLDDDAWRMLYSQSGPIRGSGEMVFAPCQFQQFPPVAHVPVTVGVLIGKLADLRTIHTLYLARLMNLLVACAGMWVVFALVDHRPRLQLILFALAAAPANMSLSAAISADPVTVVMAFLVFVLAVRLKDTWTERDFWIYVAAAALLGLCKNVYFPLAALAFPAIWCLPESARRRLARIAIVIAATVIPLALWMLYIREFTSKPTVLANASPSEQVHAIMASPVGYVITWLKYLINDVEYLRRAFIGHMGWGESAIPGGLADAYFAMLTVLGLVGLRGSSEKRFEWIEALWRLVLCAAVAFLVYTALYVMSGRGVVFRTTGRYYMALSPLVFSSLPIVVYLGQRVYRYGRIAVLVLWGVAVAISAYTVADRYWGDTRTSYWLGEMSLTHQRENAHRAAFGVRENGDFVLRAASPSVFDLRVPSSSPRQVAVEFGILDGASKGANNTDGVEFEVSAAMRGRPREVIWRQLLAPKSNPQDRGLQLQRISIPDGARILTFKTKPGANGDNKWDWAYWRKVTFDPQ